MRRFRRVAEVWNWLPAFRAVAEHQSVHAAADALSVSPSALSRTVRLLEDALGVRLFDRAGNRLSLTPIGEQLLSMARDAMRMVDDGIAGKDALVTGQSGLVVVGVTSASAAAVAASAIAKVTRSDARATFSARSTDEDVVEEELLRGDLDLAVTTAPATSSELVTMPLPPSPLGVYVDPAHPLARHPGVALEDLQDVAFVAPRRGDSWPADRRRDVRVNTDALEMTVVLCRHAALACVLPDVLASELGLARVCALSVAAHLHAVRRKPLSQQELRVLDALFDALESG
jgi:DNA-binding transcriptional LysR family regulator